MKRGIKTQSKPTVKEIKKDVKYLDDSIKKGVGLRRDLLYPPTGLITKRGITHEPNLSDNLTNVIGDFYEPIKKSDYSPPRLYSSMAGQNINPVDNMIKFHYKEKGYPRTSIPAPIKTQLRVTSKLTLIDLFPRFPTVRNILIRL
ncbi:hypothetical protein [Staphylococcus phage vB_SauH_DELF3]|nr:hypothetical protein [Staphylococcus phage vB_SauH_DELF3]